MRLQNLKRQSGNIEYKGSSFPTLSEILWGIHDLVTTKSEPYISDKLSEMLTTPTIPKARKPEISTNSDGTRMRSLEDITDLDLRNGNVFASKDYIRNVMKKEKARYKAEKRYDRRSYGE